ncbi:phage tail sheath subtilisin-like domain-containing protein [Sphingomonas jatrophae]|uniref:Uncharacterized protein n=1 Tax=Sphingomonas jatrophae TaxID=1166337 RepID=A0A1I6JLA7_9SPHN|nr:phage tail sheath subtilisin-like domain-containing protein [Sphingomonas jatrophae]SFR79755.1 hypothetical protein SAMN05192580_0452 [Sphingomonas jatrophae]
MAYIHGIQTTEATDLATSIVPISTSVIGIVATAPDADAAAFPLNTPVRLIEAAAGIEKAGDTGTLVSALRDIAAQVRCPVVVVRVAPGADAAATAAAVIGDPAATSGRVGMQALRDAQAICGIKPRILGAPGLDTAAVADALAVVGEKLRAFVYAAATGANDAALIAYASNFDRRNLMLIVGDLSRSGDLVTVSGVATALGLRARIDQEQGWHKTLSNVPIAGIVGVTRPIGFDFQDEFTQANVLNAANLTVIVSVNGAFRFWGNRTTAAEESGYIFESATRTAHVLIDEIAAGLIWAVDKPLTPSLAKDIVEKINARLDTLRNQGRLLGAKAKFVPANNSTSELRLGRLRIDYDFTPVPPLEALLLRQTLTDQYFANFAELATAA